MARRMLRTIGTGPCSDLTQCALLAIQNGHAIHGIDGAASSNIEVESQPTKVESALRIPHRCFDPGGQRFPAATRRAVADA